MAEAPQLERPGVEVIQEFVATTPTILRPSLQPCIVGPCKQVVEAVTDEGTLDSDALVSVPARLTTYFTDGGYPIGGEELVLSINNGPPYSVVLPGTEPTPAEIADAVRTAAIPGLTARVETSGEESRVVLETTSKGDNASIRVHADTAEDILSEFEWTAGWTEPGFGGYNNHLILRIQGPDYPDPRTNSKDLKIDHDSVRVFVSPGGTAPFEVTRKTALLQGGSSAGLSGNAVTVFDDGDGDSLSPYLQFENGAFDEDSTVAEVEGIADITSIDYANEVQGMVLRMSIDGEPFQTIIFDEEVTSPQTLAAAINALWGAGTATYNGGGGLLSLHSHSQFGGRESSVRIDKNATAEGLLTALGLTGTNAPFEGTDVALGGGYPPVVGDEVWVDGLFVGTIVEIPASATNRLRLDTERLLTFTGKNWYLRASNLSNDAATAQRPGSDLLVDPNTGSITVKAGLFHSISGLAAAARGLNIYVAYDALRLDVTPAKRASDFNLLRIGSLSALEDELAPVDTQNPLALGMYFAMLNAPGLEVTGCGVDEVNDGAPEGTADAYARTFEFLESKDIYTIVPLTHSPDVGSIAAAHVNVMSEPANGLERIAILTPMRPTRKSATLVASGARANVTGAPTDIVETGLANLQSLLAAAGKPGPTYTEEDAVYIMFEGDSNHYLVQSVSGGALTINDGPLTTNTDGFYFDAEGGSAFEDMLVDRPFTVAVRGAALTNRTDEAAAYGDLGRGYRSKRVIVTAPDTVKTTLDGLESAVPGYYAAAAIAGRKASKVPSQPMTEDTLAGFTGVVGTQERYSEPQLRIMAGGGIWILYQDADGQPVRTRHQLTTDVSTLLARESSITDALDYAAKTLRTTFRNFIGRFNITTGLIEALNLVCDGVRDFLIQNNIFAAFNVVELVQDANNPDELSIVADVTTLKPLNKIRITMRVT
jgi:hypothetical protein